MHTEHTEHAQHADHAGHGDHAAHADHDEVLFTREYWDDRYSSADQLWSGQPNVQLVAQASGLAPGEALDVGSGEGADSIWLATHGWRVAALDVSAVALERAAQHAAAQGDQIAALITWTRADMYSFDPGAGRYDLVSAQYMYLPGPAFEEMFGRLAAAVRPGGTLLVVGHSPDELRARGATVADMAWSAEQLAARLDASWQILVSESIGRPATDTESVHVQDTVLRAQRRR
jgi:2-polyprenyl-3-methyl-5-hydroxy-6-metoxy-1,4-benzoquinol methylase